MNLTCLFACLLIAAAGSRKSYSGYQVLRTEALNEDTAAKLAPLLRRPEYNFWSHVSVGRNVDIMVSADHVNDLKHFLTAAGLNSIVHIADVERSVQAEDAAMMKIKSVEERQPREVTFERYMEYDEIQAYMDDMAAAWPELVTLIDIGTSYEGLPIRAVKISKGSGKNAILIDATTHAREWISTPVALKVIYELVENYSNNIGNVNMIDWYVVPVVNPDGYVYSWTDDRLWSKTRSSNPGSNCIGTDPNANFDFHWGEGSATTSPCEEGWINTNPFSEPETVALSTFMNDIPNLKMFLTLHSYGQLLMYPYGHTYGAAPNYPYMNIYAKDAANILSQVYGTQYYAEQASYVQDFTYGTSRDWAYGAAGVTYTYTFELPGGASGFNPPPEDILPCVIETWEAIKYLAQRASTTK